MKRFKKWCSFLLSLCMILALFPAMTSPVNAANASAKYKDVVQTAWYVPYIDYVVEHGLMTGNSSTSFAPNGKVTRAQYVQVLYALAGKPSGAKAAGFKDVASGKWYTDAVNWAAEVGVTGGMTKTTFAPDVAVSREQAATFFKAYASKVAKVEVDESKELSSYPDQTAVSNYAVAPMKWAVGAGLISGVKSGSKIYLQPKGTLTRAQLATMMKAFDLYLEKKQATQEKTEVDDQQVGGSDSSVNIYTVIDLSVDEKNKTATATASAPEACTMRVRFISEDVYFSDEYPSNKTYLNDGKLYATATVKAGADLEEVRASIQGTLPKYYVAEAILVDANGKELCNYCTTIEHTKRHEEFEAKTVNDFPDAVAVLNFDNDLDDNFGVLANDVRVLTASDLTVTEDENGNKTYAVKDPSAKISAGDKVFIQDSDSNELFRVKTITQKNGVYTIVPATAEDGQYGYELSDFYQFLKADMEYEGNMQGDGQLRTLSSDSEHSTLKLTKLNVIPVVDVAENVKITPKFKYDTDHFKVEGKVGVEFEIELKIEWDPNAFGKDYFQIDLIDNQTFTADIKAVAKTGNKENNKEKLEKLKESKDLSFGKIKIPFGVTGLNAFADIRLLLEWEISGGAHFTGNSKDVSGFKYNTKDGKQSVKKNSKEWKVNVEGEAEVKFGPKPSIGVEFLHGVCSAQLEGFIGAVVKATLDLVGVKWGTVKHSCTTCLDGDLKAALTADAKLKIKISKKISGTIFDWEYLNIEIPLFEFYVSIINPKDSIFGGKAKIGKGSCPNIAHKTAFKVQDSKGDVIKTKVDVSDKNGKKVAEADSEEFVWLYPGTYEAKAEINGTKESESFKVTTDDALITVTIKPATANGNQGKTSPNIITEVPEGFIGIYDANGLDKVRENPTGNYILMADIDLSSFGNWIPIGTREKPFKGVFRGENHIISNLTISSTKNSNSYAGLFGVVNGATISGINITGSIDSTEENSETVVAGGVAATIENNTWVSGCKSSVTIKYQKGSPDGKTKDASDASYTAFTAGGIVGVANGSQILGCCSYGDIHGIAQNASMVLGGIVGLLVDSPTNSSYSHCKISAATDYKTLTIGGIAGIAFVHQNDQINKCVSNCSFKYLTESEIRKYKGERTIYIGGICGGGRGYTPCTNIVNCSYLSSSATSAIGWKEAALADGEDIPEHIDAMACSQSEINNKAKEMGFAV